MTSNPGSPWRQLNLTCGDWRTAEQAAAASLRPLISSAQDAGALTAWWVTRKGGTWRIRIESPADGLVEQAIACLLRAEGVRAVTESICEPETAAFGGAAGMDAAHPLFHADSQALLSQIARPGPARTSAARSRSSWPAGCCAPPGRTGTSKATAGRGWPRTAMTAAAPSPRRQPQAPC